MPRGSGSFAENPKRCASRLPTHVVVHSASDALLNRADVGRFWPLVRIDDLEFHFFSLLEIFVGIDDGGRVNEDVTRTVCGHDETETFRGVKPLDCTFHYETPLRSRTAIETWLKQTLFRIWKTGPQTCATGGEDIQDGIRRQVLSGRVDTGCCAWRESG